MSILNKIVEEKKLDLMQKGSSLGIKLPPRRNVPIVPFTRPPLIICEIKRASPSKGIIKANIDPIKQAAEYISRGIKSISILTEERYFSGSLNDLISVKNKFPEVSILRKDFIISEEEIDVSYRAGADAILLIASIHPTEKLYKLYKKAKKYGMEVLFEIHSEEDVKKARYINPDIVGINSRSLENFTIDLFHPLRLKNHLSWKHTAIFESGIRNRENAIFVFSSGFDGILIGESVVKEPDIIKEIIEIKKIGVPNFWERLFKNENRPLIKICGITTLNDANYLEEKGADAIGFIFAPSARIATSNFLKKLQGLKIPKVGVITPESLEDKNLKKEVRKIVKERLVDALQLHGFPPSFRLNMDLLIPYYNAMRIKDLNDLKLLNVYNTPRILIDAFDPHKKGGTGKSIPSNIINEVNKITPLWIAGGIGVDNVKTIIQKFNPELIDISSSLEISPGIKDKDKIDKLFQEVKDAKIIQ